jgi:hypothetical protein
MDATTARVTLILHGPDGSACSQTKGFGRWSFNLAVLQLNQIELSER